jgi:hypothetical protein
MNYAGKHVWSWASANPAGDGAMVGALRRGRERGRYTGCNRSGWINCVKRCRMRKFVAGEFTADLLDGIDFIAVSPGLAPQRELATIVPAALEKNIPVWGEIEIFAQALAALRTERAYTPKVIAITGTNGKTTVTSLTGLLCSRAG